MLALRKIAVTGGIASGKTTVCRILGSYGAYVVSADEIVHQLLSSNTSLADRLIASLGTDIVDENSKLDRKKIAEVVFAHPEKLKNLEQLLHPLVFDEIKKRYESVKTRTSYSLFVAEIPLLYETGSEGFYDATIAVVSQDALCRARFLHHAGLPMKQYDLRLKRQLPSSEKAARADYIITNNGTLAELETAVATLIPSLTMCQ